MTEILSRDQAKLKNIPHYYTGIPCDSNHDSKRYTISGKCIACENIKSSEYAKRKKPNILLTKAKNRAKQKNLEFNIDITDIVIPKKCPVLGIDIISDGSKRYTNNSPSVDRIDNNKGYIKGNVTVISYRANALKNDATIEELQRIVKYMKDGQKKNF